MKTSKNQEALNFFSRDVIESCIKPEELAQIRKERLESKVSSRAIYVREKGDLTNAENTEMIRLSAKDFPVTCDIAVFEDKVRIASFKERIVGVVIEDREVAQSFRALFELAWKWVKQNK